LNTTTLGDRDGDGSDDTVQIDYGVLSNAFFEDLDVEITVSDSSGALVDMTTDRIAAGGGSIVDSSVYFTAPLNGMYSFSMVMKDMLGSVVDTLQTSPQSLNNMQPVANGTLSLTDVQTWENLQFQGDGFDAWGLSLDNNTLPYLDAPIAYAWDFGDNVTSNLKSPLRSYASVGSFNATLRVMDQGGSWSETEIHPVNVTDSTDPFPVITVNNIVIEDEISLLTNQRILFSAGRTTDNVPLDYLDFHWDWGDGTSDSGLGVYSQQHEWGDIDGENITYDLILTVFDGNNNGTKIIKVNINNRLPVQIYSETMMTMTYTNLVMPDVFIDDDGTIEAYDWTFTDGVRIAPGIPQRGDDYSTVSSSLSNPIVSWDVPGNKTLMLTVTDDDGSEMTTMLNVVVLNQLPVASFEVISSSTLGSQSIDFREQDGEVDEPYTFDGRDSTDPDGTVGDSTDLVYNWTFSDGTFGERPQVTHAFSEPGIHSVTLVVIDERGESSFPRTMTVRIINPLPIIQVRILDGWIDDQKITSSTSFPEGSVPDGWSHTFNEEDHVVTAPGDMLYFDSAGTRDGDRRFEGRYVPFEAASPDWNGLVQYTWDFGDATPLEHDASPWHAYILPGTYHVTLTVRDAFGTGDVTRMTFTVVVNSPPEIYEIFTPEEIIAGDSYSFNANVSDMQEDMELEIYRDLDVEDGSIYERDERIQTELVVRWDFDLELDENENGNAGDDWVDPTAGYKIRASHSWEFTGYYDLKVEVCDGLGQCESMTKEVEVVPEPEGPPSLSDFTADEWKSWVADAGSELATFIGLIAVALILGWLVMREPSSLEEEAKEAAETYSDVEMVESQGGLLGMDHHLPPPAPKILSKDERRSDDSGYIRPLRRR
jgi:PKD repeat protein